MRNPWLDIPLVDYEGHMALARVAQAELLGDIFARLLHELAPESVAVLGCAGGNGFERISPQCTRRVVGIDLNPAYIAAARDRFQGRFPVLELFVGDIQTDEIVVSPVDLVYVGLVFEYVDVHAVLDRIGNMLKPKGVLATVVQLPSSGAADVTPSPFKSLESLSSCLRLVPPQSLCDLATSQGYRQIDSRRETSRGGKSFQVQTFCGPATS